MRTILCTSDCLYELYDLVLLLRRSGYEVVLAMSMGRAIAVAESQQIDAVVISAMRSGPTLVAASPLKFAKPDLPVILVAYIRHPGDVPSGVDGIVAGPDELPQLLEGLFAMA